MSEEKKAKEAEFYRRIAELRSKNNQFPGQQAKFLFSSCQRSRRSFMATARWKTVPSSADELERRVLMDLVAPTYNFRTFYKRLNYELKRANRYDRALSLLVCRSRRIWTISGKARGLEVRDNIVAASAAVMLTSIRDIDLIERCREDAFGIILPETPQIRRGSRRRTHSNQASKNCEVVIQRTQLLYSASVLASLAFREDHLSKPAFGQGPVGRRCFRLRC